MKLSLHAPDVHELAATLGRAGAPAQVYDALRDVVAAHIGFGLFTMLVTTPDGEQVQRVYSTNTEAYAVGGMKQMGATPLGDRLLKQHQPYMCHDALSIRQDFPDHPLIFSLGLGSVINVPVVAMGRALGMMNVLDKPGRFGPEELRFAQALAPILVAPFLRELQLF